MIDAFGVMGDHVTFVATGEDLSRKRCFCVLYVGKLKTRGL